MAVSEKKVNLTNGKEMELLLLLFPREIILKKKLHSYPQACLKTESILEKQSKSSKR